MKRTALIVGYGGEKGKKGYLPGVAEDISGWEAFLKSPLGGAWEASEINVLVAPSELLLDLYLALAKNSEYVFVAFTGHGALSSDGKDTLLQINSSTSFSARKLEVADRQCIVLDCCREPVEKQLKEAFEHIAAASSGTPFPHPHLARQAFDDAVMRCSEMTLIAHSCDVNELSYDERFERGGLYTYSLFEVMRDWGKVQPRQPAYARSYSLEDAHEAAKILVTEEQRKQHPKLTKPRSGAYLPMCVWV